MNNDITIVRFSRNGNMVLLHMPDGKDKWFFLNKTVETYYKKHPADEGTVVEIKYEESTKKGDASTITFMQSNNQSSPVENKSSVATSSANGKSRTQEKWSKYGSPEDVRGKKMGCALAGACQLVSGMGITTTDDIKNAVKTMFEYNMSLLND